LRFNVGAFDCAIHLFRSLVYERLRILCDEWFELRLVGHAVVLDAAIISDSSSLLWNRHYSGRYTQAFSIFRVCLVCVAGRITAGQRWHFAGSLGG
jgi:hypothetical protein